MITTQFEPGTATLTVTGTGEITHADYADSFIPAVDAAVAECGKINLIYVFSADYEGFTTRAAWDDARLGLSHFKDLGRIAMVTDHEWIRNSVAAFAIFMPAEIRTFALDDIDAANTWVRGG